MNSVSSQRRRSLSLHLSAPTTVHTHGTCSPCSNQSHLLISFSFPPKQNSHNRLNSHTLPFSMFLIQVSSSFSLFHFYHFLFLSIALLFFFFFIFRISSPSRASTTSSQVLLFPQSSNLFSSSHLIFSPHSSFCFNSCN